MPVNGPSAFERYRRLLATPNIRRLVGETRVSGDDYIYPLFITAAKNVKEEIPPMPGCYQVSVDRLDEELDEIESLGIPGVLLVGLPAEKDPVGSIEFASKHINHIHISENDRGTPGKGNIAWIETFDTIKKILFIALSKVKHLYV